MTISSRVDDLKPLTSLRFVAALMIVVYHSRLYFSSHWSWLSYVSDTSVHGVSFFFVLSGFILTHVYSSKQFPGYGTFILTRFARLWPVHVFSLLILVTLVRPDSITFDCPGLFNKWIVLVVNLGMLQSAVPTISYMFSWNSVSWSISTEFYFYLMFPLLLVNIQRTWYWKLAAFALIALVAHPILAALHIPDNSPDYNAVTILPVVYANPLVRGFEFSLGMSAWVLWNKYVRHLNLTFTAWTGIEAVAVLVVSCWLFKFTTTLTYAPSFVSMWFAESGSAIPLAAFIVVMAAGRGVFGKLLSLRAMIWLGEISFSVYMLHQILMKIFITYPQIAKPNEFLFFGVLLALSAASYAIVEIPIKTVILRVYKAIRLRSAKLAATAAV